MNQSNLLSTNKTSFTIFLMSSTACPRTMILLYSGQCYADCPSGTYPDYSTLVCSNCSNSLCMTCKASAPTICFSCYPGSNRILSAQNCTPAIGYYESNGTILTCPAPCLSCANTS